MDNDNKLINQILNNAQMINNLRQNMRIISIQNDRQVWKYDNKQAKLKAREKFLSSPVWLKAYEQYHNSYDALAFPGGLEHGLSLLKKKDPSILPTAIIYVKADPYFFRSGYIKQKILTHLKKFNFNADQIKALQHIIIDAILNPKSGFKYYVRLALKISDINFLTSIQKIIKESDNPIVSKRAQQVFNLLQTQTLINS
jgi:hypothetical protein